MTTIVVHLTDGTSRTFHNAEVQGVVKGNQFIEVVNGNDLTTHAIPVFTIRNIETL